MAPKRAKGRASSTASSQPGPEPQRPSRTSGRKRRHSDASNVSDRPSSSQSNVDVTAATPAKRRRKGKANVDQEPQVIIEEPEDEDEIDANEGAPVTPLACNIENGSLDAELAQASSSKHVHFGSTLDPADEQDDENSTATNITPHPRKLVVKRRSTLSPGTTEIKRSKTTITSRTSLPSTLSQEDEDGDTIVIQELQFAPLRSVLDERVRRRLRRSGLSEEMNEIEDHEKRDSRTQKELEQLRIETAEKEARIAQLMLDLETQRQFAIDVSDETSEEHQKVLRMEAQLEALKNEFRGDQKLSHQDLDMLDDDMMVLNSQEEVVYPHLPTPETTESTMTTPRAINGDSPAVEGRSLVRTERYSFAASAQANWDIERRKFEDAIMALSREADDAKVQLRVLEIQLEALGFGAEGESSKVILESIREAFDRTRESLDAVLPDTVPESCSSEDILEVLTSNLESFAQRLRLQDEQLQNKDLLIADLGKQIEGLLDHLAEAEIRKTTLQQQWRELDESADNKSREIEDLEADLQAALEERHNLRVDRDEKQEEVKAMGDEHALMIKNVERLTMSLENYRVEETRLTELITKMEDEHRTVITKMNQEREEVIGDLEARLDNETSRRDEAELQLDDREKQMTDLESQIENIQADRDTLAKELVTITIDRDAQRDAYEIIQTELDDKNGEIEELEGRVTRLEEELDDLNNELIELRKATETERNQREAAESDLDERNGEIEELNIKLREQGTEANQLRQKLFEVQQTNQARTEELEKNLSDQDAQYQQDIAEEVERRQAADELAQTRAASILELETRIEEVELEMRASLQTRDERVAELEDLVASRDAEIVDLQDDIRDVERNLDTEKAKHEEQTDELEGSIAALKETIDQHEETILDLRQAAEDAAAEHESSIEDRNATIADINARVATLNSSVDELQAAKDGLERRVEAEAEQMLQLQNEKFDEIESLKGAIRDKQAKILVVEQKAIEADRTWQEVLAARDEEIAVLRKTTTTSEQTIETLTGEYAALQSRLQEFVKSANERFAKLRAAVETANIIAGDEAQQLNADGDTLLNDVEAADVLGRLQTRKETTKKITTTQSTMEAPIQGPTKKGKGRKKRVVDSGIGLEADGDESMFAL